MGSFLSLFFKQTITLDNKEKNTLSNIYYLSKQLSKQIQPYQNKLRLGKKVIDALDRLETGIKEIKNIYKVDLEKYKSTIDNDKLIDSLFIDLKDQYDILYDSNTQGYFKISKPDFKKLSGPMNELISNMHIFLPELKKPPDFLAGGKMTKRKMIKKKMTKRKKSKRKI